MKTVAASLRAVDDSFRWSGDDSFRGLGRLTADACVRLVRGLPHEVPGSTPPSPAALPAIRLAGGEGRWLLLVRRAPGEDLSLTDDEGETEVVLSETAAVTRVREFVESRGEEASDSDGPAPDPGVLETAAEASAPDGDPAPEKAAEALPRESFLLRPFLGASVLILVVSVVYALAYAAALIFVPALSPKLQIGGGAVLLLGLLASPWLFSRKVELVVDHQRKEIREHAAGRDRVLAAFTTIREADVERDERRRSKARIVLVLLDGAEGEAGNGWPPDRAVRIAEAVNDAIDVPESRRNRLRYRLGSGG